jgi:hypothetical protein
MAISRSQMYRQLKNRGGIMQLEPRSNYILGGIAKSVKKAVKGVAGGIKDLVSSDVGKLALLAAGGYYAGGGNLFGLQRAGMSGFSLGNLPGAALFTKGAGVPGVQEFAGDRLAFNAARTAAGKAGLSGLAKVGLGLSGSALIGSFFGGDMQQAQEMYQRNPNVIRTYLRQYYQNINPDADAMEVDRFVEGQLSEYAGKQDLADGGRVGFEEGGTFLTMEEAAERDPAMFMDTTTYNPIPEDAARQNAAEIARYMKGVRDLPREEGEIEDTETMGTTRFMFEKVLKPRRKEIMENFGLSMEEVDDLIKEILEEMKKLSRTNKADGGMPMGIMRLNQAGVKERDYREDGGFVPVGIKEKADDVPAMLSKNEFVMTADAVRGAGDGDVEKGAQRMYRVMKTLENGGRI